MDLPLLETLSMVKQHVSWLKWEIYLKMFITDQYWEKPTKTKT